MEVKYSVFEGDFNQVAQKFDADNGVTSAIDRNQVSMNFYPYDDRPFWDFSAVENGFKWVNKIANFEDKACVSFLYKNSLDSSFGSFCLIYSKKNSNHWVACHIRNPHRPIADWTVHLFSPVSCGALPQETPEKDFQKLCTALLAESSREQAQRNKLIITLTEAGTGDQMQGICAIERLKYTPEWILSAIIDQDTGAVKHGETLNAFKAKINPPNYEHAVTTLATHWSYRYFSPAPNLRPVRITPAICLTSIALAAGFLATGHLTLPLALALSLMFLLSLAKTYATFQANEAHVEHVLSV